MTSKERVKRVLDHRIPDRVPWGEHAIDFNVYEMFLGRPSLNHAKFRETQAYWAGRNREVAESYMRDTVELVQILGMDLVTASILPPADYRPPAMEQVDDFHYRDASGQLYALSDITGDLMKTPVNTAYFQKNITYDWISRLADEAAALPPLDPDPRIPQYAAILYAVEQLGRTHFIIAPINGIEWPRYGETEEDSWINLLLEPEISEKIAAYQYYHTVRELDRLAASGIDGVLSVGDLGMTTGLSASPELYRRIILPYHRMLYHECKRRGLYVLRHCCGHIWPIIEDIADCNDAYESIQERAGMDILRLKEAVGSRLALWGGVLHEHIHGGTPEQVYADARRSILGAGKGGGLILGSSHSLTVGATKENILSMKQALEDFGRYGPAPGAGY